MSYFVVFADVCCVNDVVIVYLYLFNVLNDKVEIKSVLFEKGLCIGIQNV